MAHAKRELARIAKRVHTKYANTKYANAKANYAKANDANNFLNQPPDSQISRFPDFRAPGFPDFRVRRARAASRRRASVWVAGRLSVVVARRRAGWPGFGRVRCWARGRVWAFRFGRGDIGVRRRALRL